MYDEVDEEEYSSVVKNRLAQDDFVEDDGVGGYVDHGMDVFDEEENYDEEDVKRKCHYHNLVCNRVLINYESKKREEIVQAEGQTAPRACSDGCLQGGGI